MRPPSGAGAWRQPMVARSPDEDHRTATVLELFFDLCFLVAVAQAADRLHHAVTGGHLSDGVLGYALVFFAIWWAWMNFTWFASAYDPDDLAYRLTTLVQIAGALILAAGVPRAMDRRDFGVTTVGYVVMRLAMVTQWLRAARSDPPRRRCCLRYAVGTLLQLGWVGLLAGAEQRWALAAFALLAVGELAVPVWAERAAPTTWHPHHIAERYGLFTIIVLGESVLAATLAVQSALDAEIPALHAQLATIATGGLLTVFAMWWLYFATDAGRLLSSLRAALTWGYGHYLVFGSAAAVGAGLAVTVDAAVHHARISERAAGVAFTLPVTLFLLTVWALQLRPHYSGRWHTAFIPAAALAVLATAFTPQPVLLTGLLMAALVAASLTASRPQPATRPR